MEMKRLVYILIGLVLIAFGVGAMSLRYNDDFRFKNFSSYNGSINIDHNNKVNIGSKGIEVMDGDKYVSINWDGIKVIDGDEKVSVGWDGIKVDDGRKTKVDIGKWNWLNFRNELEWFSFDEERFVEVDNKENISILSTFIDIEIISEDRKDIKVLYQGQMKADTAPELEINKKINEIEIKLADKKTYNYAITNSDMILRIFIPKDYNETIKVLTTSSDINIEDFKLKELNLVSTSGDIELEDINADILILASTSGDIEVVDFSGVMDLETTSGDIKIDNKKNDKDIKIATSSGNVYINFAKDASYTIAGSSTSGDFRNHFPMTVDTNNLSGSKTFKGIIGNGKNNMEIQTTSGDVKFNSTTD